MTLLHQRLAAGNDIRVGGFKVAGIPRVGDIAVNARKIEQLAALRAVCRRDQPSEVCHVRRVHADNQVVFRRLVCRKQPRSSSREWDAVSRQFVLRSMVRIAADFVRMQRGGLYLNAGEPRFGNKVFHYEFCHWTAADVPVANKQYFHITIPFMVLRANALSAVSGEYVSQAFLGDGD